MSDKMKNIPKLRFPQFVNSGEWGKKTLKELAENLDNKRVPITSNVRSKGDIPYYGASGIVDYVNDYIFDEELLCISEDGANLVARTYPIAFSISGKTWVNNHAHVLKFQNKYTQVIVENYLNSIKLDDFLTGMAQPKLNKAMLDIIPIPISPKPKEQEKIADCLSSIDSLITVQSQKIELLKEHKNGLLQNLFPKDGEEIPKIRFPEFLNDGKWEEKQLDDIVKSYSSSIALNKLQLKVKGYPVYGADSIVGYIDEFQHEKEYISIVKDGSGVGRLNFCESQSSILGTLTCLKSKNEKLYDLKWIYYLLNTIDFSTYIKGAGIPHIYYSDYKNENILVPKIKEQKKIADSLTSIDEKINLQSQKLDALKEHKKALLQQFFPKL